MIALFFFFIAGLGLIVGSFLNVLTLRLAADESIVFPASHCPHCHHALAWYDLIPVLSFVLLAARCRYCHVPISSQYPLVELATMLAFLGFAIKDLPELANGAYLPLLRDFIFAAGLIALFVFDARWYIVPDEVSLPLAALSFLLSAYTKFTIVDLLTAMAIGGGFYAILWAASRGRWVGSGDIRLGLVMGAMLGTVGVLLGLYAAYVIGGLIGAALLLSGRKKLTSHLPMGVFLTIGTFIVLFFGDWLRHFIFPF